MLKRNKTDTNWKWNINIYLCHKNILFTWDILYRASCLTWLLLL